MAMTKSGENGWQYGKTGLECHRYILDNEIATDVCFEVGPPDGAVVSIRAHKYMLISRSAVFEAMFSSGMIETQIPSEGKIRIEEIKPDAFKEMLRFLYSDSAEINSTSALELIYAAKKYMLPNLVQPCSECLQNDLTAENVCHILNQSQLIGESDLTNKCIELVEYNSSEVLKAEVLENASRQTMEAILQLDFLKEDETVIYEACINWAKAQLKIQQLIDHPNDQQIREMLGDLIYNIRFPAMDAHAFAKLVEGSTVLSYEEQSAIFCYITSEHKKDNMKFNCCKRTCKEQSVDRGGIISTDEWISGHDAIDVKTDEKVFITGLGLLPEKDATGLGYTVDLEILKESVSVFKMSTTVPCTGNSTPQKVAFQTPVVLEPGILYTVVANSCIGKRLYRRESCQPICKKDKATFTFSATECRQNNSTGPIVGQIPHIYFKIGK